MDIPEFCIILPMYNEAKNAQNCVEGIIKFLRSEQVKFQVIAVNDGSSDGTLNVLRSIQKEYLELIILNHEINSGYGAAVRTGFQFVIENKKEYALVMDADGTQSPRFIKGFFKPMSLGVDFIKATRYTKNGRVIGVPLFRRSISWFGNHLAQIMLKTPLTDYTNGFRAIKLNLLQKLKTTEKGFPVLLEEVYLARKLNATFDEVSYTLNVRQASDSGSKFVYSFRVYKSYLKYLFKK